MRNLTSQTVSLRAADRARPLPSASRIMEALVIAAQAARSDEIAAMISETLNELAMADVRATLPAWQDSVRAELARQAAEGDAFARQALAFHAA